MTSRVLSYIRRHQLIKAGHRVAVAVSGGSDSVALLRILLNLRSELGIVLSVAHLNHKIRGAPSDEDERFVAALAVEHGLAAHLDRADAPAHARQEHLSLEAAGRHLRYAFFRHLIDSGAVDRVATAHTLDDQAETVLLRLLRGTGPTGIAGIYESHGSGFIRPLLQLRRSELNQFLRQAGQSWREDPSNQDVAHTRNRVRHELLPRLEADFNPNIRQVLADLAEIAREEERYWTAEVSRLLPLLLMPGRPSRSGRDSSGAHQERLALDAASFAKLPPALQRRLLRALAAERGFSLEFRHVEALRDLAASASIKHAVDLPGGYRASRTLRELVLAPAGEDQPADYSVTLDPAQHSRLPIPHTDLCLHISTPVPLTLRNWRPGDRFHAPGASAPKKVKDLLSKKYLSRELSPAERKLWPVVADSAGSVLWVRGLGMAASLPGQPARKVFIEELPPDGAQLSDSNEPRT